MFLETNKIDAVVFAIDGFIRLGESGERYKKGNGKYDLFAGNKHTLVLDAKAFVFLGIILKSKLPFRIVSKLSEDIVLSLLSSYSDISQNEVFSARNNVERAFFAHVICRARTSMGFNANACILVGADLASIQQAQRERLGTILYRFRDGDMEEEYGLSVQGADFNLNNEQDLERIFQNKFHGYYGELVCSGKSGTGTFLEIMSDKKDSPILVSGRYFKIGDVRHKKSLLSKRILKAKEHAENHADYFSKILIPLVHFATGDNFDYVTRVPLRPSKIAQGKPDRLKVTLEAVSKRTSEYAVPADKIDGDILVCVKDYLPQHECPADKRRENVKDAFKVQKKNKVNGKIVVIVDDTLTTGATMFELINVLYENGAKKVIPVALAFNVNDLIPGVENLFCSKCGGQMFEKTNRKDGNIFWGCGNWKAGEVHDIYDFFEGVRKLNDMTNDSFASDFEGLENIEF